MTQNVRQGTVMLVSNPLLRSRGGIHVTMVYSHTPPTVTDSLCRKKPKSFSLPVFASDCFQALLKWTKPKVSVISHLSVKEFNNEPVCNSLMLWNVTYLTYSKNKHAPVCKIHICFDKYRVKFLKKVESRSVYSISKPHFKSKTQFSWITAQGMKCGQPHCAHEPKGLLAHLVF